MCLLDGEDRTVPGTMRPTGDWVDVRDQQLFLVGRRDRMIKRNGKRVDLDLLQQVRPLNCRCLRSVSCPVDLKDSGSVGPAADPESASGGGLRCGSL